MTATTLIELAEPIVIVRAEADGTFSVLYDDAGDVGVSADGLTRAEADERAAADMAYLNRRGFVPSLRIEA